MLPALLFGLLFGFVGSMPLAGPISLMVFTRGLGGAWRGGLAIAAGAALAEGGYAFLAYWGMGELLTRLPVLALVARGLAALILVGLGVWFLRAQPASPSARRLPDHLRSSFAIGLGVTALNPTLLATWTAAAAVLHSLRVVAPTLGAAGPFALGVAVGIAGWFALLLAAIDRYRDRFHPELVRVVLRVVGALLIAMGAWAAVALIVSVD